MERRATALQESEFELLMQLCKNLRPYNGDTEILDHHEITTFEEEDKLHFVLPKGGTITLHTNGTWEINT